MLIGYDEIFCHTPKDYFNEHDDSFRHGNERRKSSKLRHNLLDK